MFYYLNGTVALLDANLAVIDCGGVGYACHTSNYTLARLQTGKPAKLFTYCNIKEDAFDIYGFSTRRAGSKTAEATAALVGLGYSQTEAAAALKGLDVENLSIEDIIRQALRAAARQ